MNLKDVLKRNHKYTLAKFNNKGFLEVYKFVLVTIVIKPLSHGKQKYTIVRSGSLEKLKWDKFINLGFHEQFVIWEGYHKVNTSIVAWRGLLDGVSSHTISEKRWPTFDPRYILRAIRSVKTTPLAHYVEPLQPEMLLNFQCISS